MKINDLINSVEETDSTFLEITGPSAELAIGEKDVRFQGRTFDLRQDGRDRLYASINAPAAYLARLTPQTQANVLNEVLRRGDRGERVSVILRDSHVFSVSRSDLIQLRHQDVVTAVMETLGEHAHTLSVAKIAIDGDRVELE